ncbi:hypothetical protein BHE74_00042198 [Ensete ventricosum]|nr:hypothetical protein BHE74_00042198 [Ensete ventricosum]RZS26756.1 hypothetical protein BHM03_00060145 [Ensete ventricosum]
MQGLIHGRWSVHGHPKVRSELSAMKYQNFLFDMERIRPKAAEMYNKFSTLLDPEGCRSSTSVNKATARRDVDSRGECHSTAEAGLPCMIEAAEELDYFSAHIRLREPDKSEDKIDWKVTDSRATGLATPWYRRGGTFVESSIPCSHGGRALVIKGAKEVENAKTNSKYQDRGEGQRPRNFIRPMSMDFSSR